MTMNAGIARALRRFAGGVAIMLALLSGMHARLYAEIQVPPEDVDRIVVTSPEGRSHEITDRAAVAEIVRQVRSLRNRALRITDRVCFFGIQLWRVGFYRGAKDRDGILLHNQLIITQGAHIGLSTEEALDLHRLLGTGGDPSPSAEGDGR